MPGYRGRFAPSPTGDLHLGSMLAACASWLDARAAGGEWLIRIEDIDPPREQPGASASILRTLAAFGMHSDRPAWYQSLRAEAYEVAIERLLSSGDAFECRCSRADLAAGGGIHRGTCTASPANRQRRAAIRLRVPVGHIGFHDRVQGDYAQNLAQDVGDFVLRRADGLYAYQLAVVVDDAAQGITHVVRGADLLDSTPRQLYLQQRLGLPHPVYAHVPLLVDALGQKLSKQNLAPAVAAGQERAVVDQVLGLMGQPIPSAAYMTAAQALNHASQDWSTDRIPSQLSLPLPPGFD